MPRPAPWRALVAASLLSILAVAACGGDEPPTAGSTSTTASPSGSTSMEVTTTTAPPQSEVRTISASFADGSAVDGGRTETVALGEPVRIEVTGDTAGEIHVHGYDLFADVTPASPAVFEFTADLPGVWEVEVEGSHLLLFHLQVEP